MANDPPFSDAAYGFDAGLFFIDYCLFEIPSNLVMTRVATRQWMTRIMITWGGIPALFLFIGDFKWGGVARFGGADRS